MKTDDLFDFPIGMPLAARMRPRNLDEFVGQTQILGDQGVLRHYLSNSQVDQSVPSMIFYGPPGTGKTTLARLLASSNERRFIEISAINSSIADLRDAMSISLSELEKGRKAAIVFIDEIHRFSKVQQESLLKAVEDGEIVLIGATTENPSFALTSAMLSRAAVIELLNIEEDDLIQLLKIALESERGLEGKFSSSVEVMSLIASQSGGDARKALTILETAANRAARRGINTITAEDVSSSINKALNRYDATGDQHYDIISAFIKSVRGSDADAALHWLARMIVGGEDPRFIARRLVILASEDIGLADPNALVIANATMQVVAQIGMPEGRIPLASTTIYLALAPKSNRAYEAINSAISDVEDGISPAVPRHLRSASLGKDPGYEYPHDLEGGVSAQEYVPEAAAKKYYNPKAIGFEGTLIERISRILPFLRRNT